MKLSTITFLLILINFSFLYAGNSNLRFIDLDGDGINDNIPDIDNNNIPDDFQNNLSLNLPENTKQFSGFSGLTDDTKTVKVNLTSSERFSLRKYTSRGITTSRCDFDAEFGTRLGISSSGGGSCAGGICF